jgi:hypothetical protein
MGMTPNDLSQMGTSLFLVNGAIPHVPLTAEG